MKASDIMTRQPISVPLGATLADAAGLMLQNHISGLPVTDATGRAVGVVTEGDLLRRTETGTERRRPRWLEFLLGPGRLATDYIEANARKVADVMTAEVVSVAPDDTLETVVQLMEKRHIKRVPVVDDGRLVGIISRADLVRALLRTLTREAAEAAKEPMTDDDIRAAIVAVLDKEPWGPRFSIDVKVEDGVVELNGTVTDDRARAAVVVAAERTPGVKAVRDHVIWVEPTTGFATPAGGEVP